MNTIYTSWVGGISGDSQLIMNSSMAGTLRINAIEDYRASNIVSSGIVINGEAKNCVNYANIIGVTEACGIVYSGFVDGCINYGNISSDSHCAGICISSNGGDIKNSINYGTIECELIGAGISIMTANVMNCINYGDVKAKYASGILNQSTTARNIINYGNVYTTGHGAGISNAGCKAFNMINIGNMYVNALSNDIYCGGIFGHMAFESYLAGAVSIGNIYYTNTEDNYTNDVSIGALMISLLVLKENTYYQAYDFRVYDKNNIAFKDNQTPVATLDMLNSKSFWLSLGFDEVVFNMDNLDYENEKYPTLRFENELLEKFSNIFENFETKAKT